MAKILLLDDERALLRILARTLERAGHSVVMAATGREALAAAENQDFEILVTDLKLAHESGLLVAQQLRALQPEIGVLVLTAYASVPSAVEAMRLGVDDYLIKPVETEELLLRIAQIVEKRELKFEVVALRSRLAQSLPIIGETTGLRTVFASLDQVARSGLPVLVLGESGTGKELVAREVHRRSGRGSHAFVAVNCGALPEHLLESELFGHVQGAFTGADRARRGLFEEADQGTLFLDEIGDVPPSLQVRLLRVLQDQEVRPVGANSGRRVDVRIVAATHRDLGALVASGAFREDLYFRMNVLPVRIPSLRARREDIAPLTDYFVAACCQRTGRPVPHITEAAREALRTHPWPGNVRELRNVLERSLIFCTEQTRLDRNDLQFDLHAQNEDFSALFAHLPRLPSLEELKNSYLQYVLASTQGNQARAAEILQVGKNTVWRRVREQREGGEP